MRYLLTSPSSKKPCSIRMTIKNVPEIEFVCVFISLRIIFIIYIICIFISLVEDI